ncbi:MAG: hypothetical protein AAFR81_01635 [Chloroflexota bacterium]
MLDRGKKSLNDIVLTFNFFQMPVKMARSARYGLLAVFIVSAVVAIALTPMTPLDAVLTAGVVTMLHLFCSLLHHYGHFLSAKWAGKPSTGVQLWGILGTTLYPMLSKVTVTPKQHMQRAIGGPVLSGIFFILVLILTWQFWNVSPVLNFLLGYLIFNQVAVNTIGALIPMKLGPVTTDGMIIWQNWRKL